VVQAYWRIAEARRAARNREAEITSSLNDVVNAFSRSGQAPGSMAAEYAANSRFILADGRITEFESFRINPGSPATMQAYVNNITSQINEGASRAQSIVQGYEPVTGYNRPTWTIAAFVRQGRTYEVLARSVLNAPFVVPSDLQRQMRRLPPEDRDQIRLEVEGTVQGVLDQRVRPIECFAVARYALAARAARAGNIDNEYTRIAVDRLQAYGEERIAECIAEAQRNDPSFQAYSPGEFTRAPRGQTLEPREGISPPGLAPRSR
jgi:cellulose synthase operon protein C